jgi:DNA-binding transcriptional LysR family regulator
MRPGREVDLDEVLRPGGAGWTGLPRRDRHRRTRPGSGKVGLWHSESGPMIDVRLLRHLLSFLAVAEESHFGRAAKRLGISQPPLTKQIQVLERSLGVTLFDRSRQGAKLTKEGAAILPAVQGFARQMSGVEAVVRAAKEGQTQFVAIGAITSTFYDLLPRILKDMLAALPRVTASFAEIHTADAVPMLRSGAIDLAFARLIRNVGSIRVVAMVRDHLLVALPTGHRLAAEPSLPIEALADEAWIHVRRQFSPDYFDRIISACSVAGFSPRLVYEVGSEASQIAFVSCGLGIALVHGSLARNIAPNIAFRPLTRPVEMVTASLAWDEERVTPVARKVIEIALGKCAG